MSEPVLDAGDIVWVDFEPRTGREPGDRRPALVVSPSALWAVSRMALVCPITSRIRPFASGVVLPEGLPVRGEVLTSQIRSIDTLARHITHSCITVPVAVLAEVRAKLAVLTGIAS